MATSAASTFGNSWNRRLSDNTECFAHQPLYQGMRSPPSVATLELPQGKVLVVVENASIALNLQRLLHEAGWRVIGPATTVAEIQRTIRRGGIDCAILDLDIDRRAPLPIADLLAFADVPFVYLTNAAAGLVPSRHRRRPVVETPVTREALLAAVEKAIARERKVVDANRWPTAGMVVPWERVYPPI